MLQCTYTGRLGPWRQTPHDGARKVDNIITTWGQELTPPTIIGLSSLAWVTTYTEASKAWKILNSRSTQVLLQQRWWDERDFSSPCRREACWPILFGSRTPATSGGAQGTARSSARWASSASSASHRLLAAPSRTLRWRPTRGAPS